MHSAMAKWQSCFSLRKFLVISSAIRKSLAIAVAMTVVHLDSPVWGECECRGFSGRLIMGGSALYDHSAPAVYKIQGLP